MKPLVSIIIPIYNVQDYIAESITSLVNQKYNNLELILIDDGSTDNSLKLALEVLKDQEVPYKIIPQTNMGVSAARNRGIDAANGDWIVMIDPDDTVHEDFVLTMLESIDTDNIFNVAVTDYQIVSKHDIKKLPRWHDGKEEILKEEAQNRFLRKSSMFILPTMLVSKGLLDKYSIRLDEQCRFSEDTEFVWMVMCYAEKIVHIKQPLYNYCHHENSTMTSSGVEKIYTGYVGLQKLYKDHIDGCDNSLVKDQLKPRWIFSTIHCSAKMLSYNDYLKLLDILEFGMYRRDMLKCKDYRITLMLLAMFLSDKLGYLILRKF